MLPLIGSYAAYAVPCSQGGEGGSSAQLQQLNA